MNQAARISASRQAAFLDVLARLEQRLAAEGIPYVIFGSLAACAWIDQGATLDFDRPGARDPAERVPDIDLLVPRASLGVVRSYARDVRRGRFPVSIDMFWSQCWIDFRPGAGQSYLTHRKVRLAVRSELFAARTAVLLGQHVTVLDPRTLLHLYSTVGVERRKDTPRINGLAQVIAAGTAASRFTDEDCQVFTAFRHARRGRYPLFFAAKHAWVVLVDTLPPGISQALTHHVQLPANQVFRTLTGLSRHETRDRTADSPT